MVAINLDAVKFQAELSVAFSSVPYPEGDDFFKAIADRDYREYVSAIGHKKLWNEIAEQELVKYYDFIFFLKPQGVVYYCQAYIYLILCNYDLLEHWAFESLLMSLSKIDRTNFDATQLEIVRRFLVHCKTLHGDEYDMDIEIINSALSNLN